MFLQKVGWLSTDYIALYPRRQDSSWPPLWEPQILHMFLFFNIILFSDDTGILSCSAIFMHATCDWASTLVISHFPETDKTLHFMFVLVAMHTAVNMCNTQVSLFSWNLVKFTTCVHCM
jgi:hypothetical protein